MHSVAQQASVVLADDLSGAAEIAALMGPGTPVHLHRQWRALPVERPVVVDVHTRGLPAARAYRTNHAAAGALWSGDGPMIAKIDSLLRGPIGAAADALLDVGAGDEPRPVGLLCPALPAQGRTVRGGVLHVAGVPLPQTELWAAEAGSPPTRVVDVLREHRGVACSLAELRAGKLPGLLADSRGAVVVCDAETPQDLDAITEAIRTTPRMAVLGAASLCGRVMGEAGLSHRRAVAVPRGKRPILVVAGTAAPIARSQAERWISVTGAAVIEVAAADLCGDPSMRTQIAAAIDAASQRGDVLLRYHPGTDPGVPGHILAEATGAAVAAGWRLGEIDLVVLGGETARAVLDAVAQGAITAVAEAHPGAVICDTGRGSLICTRPGSFGDADSLITIRSALADITDIERKP
ncbi:MAG: four-carbon acid sugar kinase family protein [Propioniciclava sp.]